MDTNSRSITDWLHKVESRQLLLPRFQRPYVWDKWQTQKFLAALLNEARPVGVFLVLQVEHGKDKFKAHAINEMEISQQHQGECNENLLDGQQRLTTLWKCLNPSPGDKPYYIYYDSNGLYVKNVEEGHEKIKDLGSIIPKKATQDHKECRIPFRYLNPSNEEVWDECSVWVAHNPDPEKKVALGIFVKDLRKKFRNRSIPYLNLPAHIEDEEVIDIFIETNESSVKISPFDIKCAMVERKQIGEGDSISFRERIEAMDENIDRLLNNKKSEDVEKVGDLVLKAACVMQGYTPSQTYKGLDVHEMLNEWDNIEAGFQWMLDQLGEINLWDDQKLPSAAPLRILPALALHAPGRGQKMEETNALIKRYLWCAFFTDHYDRQVNDRLKTDYNDILNILKANNITEATTAAAEDGKLQIFKARLPAEDEYISAEWPKQRKKLARAILAVSTQSGAYDIATNKKLTKDEVAKREYHHIFPIARLKEEELYNKALNCMLLRSSTNKEWNSFLPGDYIKEILNDPNTSLEKDDAKARLDTHLLSGIKLCDATQNNVGKQLKDYYDKFLEDRAKLVRQQVEKLTGLTHA